MVQPNARPIQNTMTPPGTPSWGAAWKKAVKDNYLSTILPATHGSCYSYRDAYLDLDPTYTDRFGRPLMRMTFDYHQNEHKMSVFLTDKLAEIVQKMGARQMVKHPRTGHWSVVPYQTTHTCGGAIMGTDPKTSAVNRYLQHWDASNLFVLGTTAFPQNAGYNPTDTVAALAFWALAAVHGQYLKNPGPLVPA
ncbi:MAG TPA: GMC oxidoreductase, partial [Rhodopila sp.]|nr:GMC oxidoreductase [Rhodopila sp.]